jgi:NAD(P)-dependent dehydrogenase (short-subunit alcohol dehydrogenase family)
VLHFHPASRQAQGVHGKPIVVTGGAGFIGSHLTDRLLEAGEQVIVVDDLSTGSRSNLTLAEKNPRFSFRRCKVSECQDLESLVADAAMVVHLAAVVGVEQVMRSPIQTIETNLGGNRGGAGSGFQESDACPAGFDFGGLRKEFPVGVFRDRRFAHWAIHAGALELCVLQAHG